MTPMYAPDAFIKDKVEALAQQLGLDLLPGPGGGSCADQATRSRGPARPVRVRS